MAVLVLQNLTTGPPLFVTFTLEAFLVSAALLLFLRRAPVVQGVTSVGFSILYLFLLTPLVMRGMEIALLVFCIALLVEAIETRRDEPNAERRRRAAGTGLRGCGRSPDRCGVLRGARPVVRPRPVMAALRR